MEFALALKFNIVGNTVAKIKNQSTHCGMREYLEGQIAKRRERLAVVDRERLKLLSEIGAYEDALAQMGGKKGASEATPRPKPAAANARGLSDTWGAILRRLSTFESFTARDVEVIANELGAKQHPVNVRSQLSNYTTKGIINRVGHGSYKVSTGTEHALTLREGAQSESTPAEAKP